MTLSAKVLALLVPCYLQWSAAAAPQLPSIPTTLPPIPTTLSSIPTTLPSIPTRSADNALALTAKASFTGFPDYWASTETNSDGLPVLTINPCKMSNWQSFTSLYPEWTACAESTQTSANALALEARAMVTGLPDYWAPTETNSDGLPVLTINPCKMSNWQSFTSLYPEWTACAEPAQTSVNTASLTGQAVVSLHSPPRRHSFILTP
jgi:hypothetical protein